MPPQAAASSAAAAPAEERPDFPSAKAVNAAGDRAIAKLKGTQHEAAAAIFKERRLAGEEFDAKQEEAYKYNGEDGLIKEQVVDPAELRKIFSEDFGDEVNSKDLFALVQAADPDGDGWVQLDAFLDVVQMRRAQLEKIREVRATPRLRSVAARLRTAVACVPFIAFACTRMSRAAS